MLRIYSDYLGVLRDLRSVLSAVEARDTDLARQLRRALREGDLNLPIVFRRVVECAQLRGLRLEQALRKFDVFDDEPGELVPGDAYRSVPVERRVSARHRR
jgi:hypothetical protein